MRGRLWLMYFTNMVESEYQRHAGVNRWADAEWTNFMRNVMDRVAEKMNCHVARCRPENRERGGEYLNIDAVFIDNTEYDLIEEEENEWDPFVLPRAVVELENDYDVKKISYCLWKILCIRAPIRVLICYQSNRARVTFLKKQLEDVTWQGSLVKGTDGDLLVIIGDDSTGDEASWEDYFTVFEWRNDRLEKSEGLEW